MELISLGKEVLQNIAEHAASYRLGQSALRQLDRVLWVVEKCARWAVPPPLDQDERPQPELVRPLPWVFFFMMLVALRVTREAISLANLIMGKPPLRSADVVMFIQSKRRYLRTLKYQGNRTMRARTSTQPQQPWYNRLNSLFELTMCFRRQSLNYGNNNTTRVTNNDEVMVIKCNKRGRQEETPNASSNETTMERLIEKMMVDLDAESDEDSNYTLTNATSPKSDISDYAESDQDTICQTSPPRQVHDTEISQTNGDDIHFSPNKNENSSSTPEKETKRDVQANHTDENNIGNQTFQVSGSENADREQTMTEDSFSKNDEEKRKLDENITETASTGSSISDNVNSTNLNSEETAFTGNSVCENANAKNLNSGETAFTENSVCANTNSKNMNSEDLKTSEDFALPTPPEGKTSPKVETDNFIKNESESPNSQRTSKKSNKIANGRSVKSVPSKKKGSSHHRERRDSNEPVQQKVLPSNSSF